MREDALQLLGVLGARVWAGAPAPAPRDGGPAPAAAPGGAEAPALMVGGIQDTYRQLQLQLSDRLARRAP